MNRWLARLFARCHVQQHSAAGGTRTYLPMLPVACTQTAIHPERLLTHCTHHLRRRPQVLPLAGQQEAASRMDAHDVLLPDVLQAAVARWTSSKRTKAIMGQVRMEAAPGGRACRFQLILLELIVYAAFS